MAYSEIKSVILVLNTAYKEIKSVILVVYLMLTKAKIGSRGTKCSLHTRSDRVKGFARK